MSTQLDTLARLLLAELRAEQARIDAIAATRRRGREVPPVRYTPLAGPAEAFGKQLLAVARGGGDSNFAPAFTAALNAFEVKHG